MMGRPKHPPKGTYLRRLWIATLVFGIFLLSNIALFSWLIFRSLSQREVERVLLETKADAEELALRIEGTAKGHGKDLYTAMAVERETQTYIDSILRKRLIVRKVEIRDKSGALVFEEQSQFHIPAKPEPRSDSLRKPSVLRSPELGKPVEPRLRTEEKEWESTFEVPAVQVPIGDLGQLQIGISSRELRSRIGVLRQDLIGKAVWIGASSMLFLVTGFLAVWSLLKRAERLEIQAAEAERLAYLGTLASGLAHEIRNPLNSLNLNMQMLEEELDENANSAPTGKRLLSITRSEIGRLERLVTDFLAYAKPRALELEETPAARPLERVRELLAGEIQRRGAKVEIEDRAGGARLRVDAGQISQLLLNLVRNAFAAVEEAGRLPQLKLSAYRNGANVCLEVADNGVGLSEEERDKMFDLFYSTRKGGTGLGLAIVDRIARAHGGEVSVRSSKGVGTAVVLELPAVVNEAPPLRGAVEAPLGA
jgi:signal transduction histidine kinase